jgi:5'-deoxynucleotidase YfbR-like HD superfamily hydrolase
MKPLILTSTGAYFDFMHPENSVIDIEVIAHALSNICRFTGHTSEFYSVAQHSVLVSKLVPPEHALAALLHDAAEAYLGDVATPLKRLLPSYAAIEEKVERRIFAHFGLPYPMHPCIKEADLIMLATEDRDLLPAHSDNWFEGTNIEPTKAKIEPLAPYRAQMQFLMKFDDLLAKHEVAA